MNVKKFMNYLLLDCKKLALISLLIFSVNWVYAASDTVSSKTFKKLNEAQELLTTDQYTQANNMLKQLLSEVKENTVDQALTYQMLGYAEMGLNNYPKAITQFINALNNEYLPEKTRYNIGYLVAQLYASEGQYDKAIDFARDWFVTLEAPTPNQYIFMANIFAQTQNYKEAVPYAIKAIEISEEPKENWYQLIISCYFELKDYVQAEKYLKVVINKWPEKAKYWEQLASVYLIRDNQSSALATLQLAWKSGLLEKKSSIQNMIQLSVNRGIPEHGARLLTKALETEALPKEEKYVDTLANAWLAAKEFDKSIKAYESLGEMTGEAKPYERITSILIQNAKWQQAESSARKALQMNPKQPGKVWYSLGVTLTEQERFGEAIEAFRKARGYPYTAKKAKSWIGYAEDLKRQQQWVKNNRET